MFWHAYPQGSASIAALAGGEIGANRQVCPAIGGGCVKLHPVQSRVRRKFAFSGFEPLARGLVTKAMSGSRPCFSLEVLRFASGKCAFGLLNASCVSNGSRFCELCENVNNFAEKACQRRESVREMSRKQG
jgi:hypothetical protein